MSDLQWLLEKIRESKVEEERMKKSDDEFEKLYYTLTYKCPKEKDELIELRKELFNFLEGEHSEEQKKKLRCYAEMFYMLLGI